MNPGHLCRLSQTLAKGITKAGVATEMVDLLSADTQELVEIVGRNSGLAILAPPSDSAEAQASLATVLSAVNPKKQKACSPEHVSSVYTQSNCFGAS